VVAPDLEAAGAIINQRLKNYTDDGTARDERRLAERQAFEHQVRRYMARAHERGFTFTQKLEDFARRWFDFVNQNKAAEAELARFDRQQQYERGRADATSAAARGLMPTAATGALPFSPIAAAPPTSPVALSDAVHQTIDALVKSEIGKHIAALASAQPAPAGAENASTARTPTRDTAGPRLSEALKLYLAPPGKKRRRTTKGRQETATIVQFAIDFLCDPVFDSITKSDWDRLDEAMPEIPLPKNIPDVHRGSLFQRYSYAQKHGWNDLSRATITTIEKRYHHGLNKFINWAAEENLYSGKKPKFACVDDENTSALPRDAFDDDELIALIKQPLFTGCAGAHRIWKPGKYFVQTHLYWGYLILVLTGMRPGEVGQLKCADLTTDGENYFFDLRPFDARKGRVALKDLRDLKSNNAGRVVPIHPLLIALGLLDRLDELEKIGERQLFPEWEKFVRRDGTVRWSQPITKSWQYVKKILQARPDLTLYSARHLMADWLDRAGIAQRTRDRILGHAGGVSGRYGRKGAPDAGQVCAIEAVDPPVIQKMREVLMAAKEKANRGELVVLKPWLARG
jgi:integrase